MCGCGGGGGAGSGKSPPKRAPSPPTHTPYVSGKGGRPLYPHRGRWKTTWKKCLMLAWGGRHELPIWRSCGVSRGDVNDPGGKTTLISREKNLTDLRKRR